MNMPFWKPYIPFLCPSLAYITSYQHYTLDFYSNILYQQHITLFYFSHQNPVISTPCWLLGTVAPASQHQNPAWPVCCDQAGQSILIFLADWQRKKKKQYCITLIDMQIVTFFNKIQKKSCGIWHSCRITITLVFLVCSHLAWNKSGKVFKNCWKYNKCTLKMLFDCGKLLIVFLLSNGWQTTKCKLCPTFLICLLNKNKIRINDSE